MKKKASIIILHGWGLSGERFAPLKVLFEKKGYRVFAPDFPGFGISKPPPTPFHLSDYAEFLETFITEHQIEDPILVGHSFGGRVSLKYLAETRGRIRALILTGTPGYTPVPRKRLMVFILLAKIGKFFFSLWPFNSLQENVRKWYYYLVGAREFYRANGVMRQVFKNVVQEDLAPYMSAVSVPSLLVWGVEDRITPLWIAKRMRDAIKGSSLIVIPDADHGVSYKAPERFVEAIGPFLKTI